MKKNTWFTLVYGMSYAERTYIHSEEDHRRLLESKVT